MSNYTISETAKMAGVSVRTLHHYDEIGLLKPAHIGANMYRFYGEAQQLRLQQILFYRNFGLCLSEIKTLLDDPDFDRLKALQGHRIKLSQQVKHFRVLMKTIDRTIDKINGDKKMRTEDLYKGFSKEKQMTYEAELSAKSPEIAEKISGSRLHNATKTKQGFANDMSELEQIENGLAAQMQAGISAHSSDNAGLITRHRAWVSGMWGADCSPSAHAGLADLYDATPDFVERYETIAEGFSKYLSDTIHADVKRISPKPA